MTGEQRRQDATRHPSETTALRALRVLWTRSIVDSVLRWGRIGAPPPPRDHVQALRHDPLGMFFYNQRALVYAAAGVFLVILSSGALGDLLPPSEQHLMIVLWAAW